jgi:ABC transporter DrrB family efflux protein
MREPIEPAADTPPAPAPVGGAPARPAGELPRRRWSERSALWQLTLARTREFYREPESLFWVFGFPLLMAFGLGIAFKVRPPEASFVAVERSPGAEAVARVLAATPLVHAEVLAPEVARDQLRTGKVTLSLVPPSRPDGPITYRFDPSRPESRLARALVDDAIQRAAGRSDPRPTASVEVTERGSRYIDFLIPGLVGMNLMSASMWGIGWTIVTARTRKLLKRLAATPMRRRDYLLSQILARLGFLVFEVAALLGFGWLVFDVGVRGSLPALATVTLAGALSFCGLGLLVACRARTTEAVSGLMNLVMLPMFVLSGVFFTSAHFPDAMQPAIRALPLTALNDALRAVMIDGASLASQARALAVLAAWGLVSFAAALRFFRWS